MYNRIYGYYGENLAINYLKKAGYKILVKNYTQKVGEADIIAIETKKARKKRIEEYKIMPKDIKKEDVIVFIEVKSRKGLNYGRPSDAVDSKKQKTYRSIANSFFLINNKFRGMQYRFDIIEVTKENVDNHIINAF